MPFGSKESTDIFTNTYVYTHYIIEILSQRNKDILKYILKHIIDREISSCYFSFFLKKGNVRPLRRSSSRKHLWKIITKKRYKQNFYHNDQSNKKKQRTGSK